VEGGVGRAAALKQVTGYWLLDFWGQTPYASSGTLAAAPRIGVIASPAAGWKTQLEVGRQRYLNRGRDGHRIARWENRLGADRRWDVRIGYEQHVAREIFAGISLYW
jgi:hypothetical protein